MRIGGTNRFAAGAFALFVLAALGCLALVAMDAPAFRQVNAWYHDLPQTNYVELVRVDEFRSSLKVGSFAAHMMIMTAQFAVFGALVGWFVCHWQPARHRRTAGRPSLHAIVMGLGLSTLAGSAILAYSLACFVSVPGSASVCALYAKEGVIDLGHTLGFLLAAALLWLAAWRHARSGRGLPDSGPIALGAALAGAAAFIVGMEEISWGQTYLAWQSPEFFMTYNDQQETNAHNFLNGYLTPIYYAMGAAILLGTVAAYVLDDRFGERWPWLRALCPPRALLWVAIWFPLGAEIFIFSSTETFETLMTIYALGYAVAILRRSRAAGAIPRTLSPPRAGDVLQPAATPALAPGRSGEAITAAAGG